MSGNKVTAKVFRGHVVIDGTDIFEDGLTVRTIWKCPLEALKNPVRAKELVTLFRDFSEMPKTQVETTPGFTKELGKAHVCIAMAPKAPTGPVTAPLPFEEDDDASGE